MKIVLSWSFARQHLAIEWPSVGHDLGTVWLRVCAEVWFLKEQEKVDEWLLAGDCCTKCSIEAVFRVTGEVSSVECNYDKWPRSQLRCPFESFMRELFSIRKEKKKQMLHMPSSHICKDQHSKSYISLSFYKATFTLLCITDIKNKFKQHSYYTDTLRKLQNKTQKNKQVNESIMKNTKSN